MNWFRRSIYQSALVLNENALPLSDWTPTTINNPLTGTPITEYNLNPTVTALPTANLYETNVAQSLVRDIYTGYRISGQYPPETRHVRHVRLQPRASTARATAMTA